MSLSAITLPVIYFISVTQTTTCVSRQFLSNKVDGRNSFSDEYQCRHAVALLGERSALY